MSTAINDQTAYRLSRAFDATARAHKELGRLLDDERVLVERLEYVQAELAAANKATMLVMYEAEEA